MFLSLAGGGESIIRPVAYLATASQAFFLKAAYCISIFLT
jgi:hypothetical protein